MSGTLFSIGRAKRTSLAKGLLFRLRAARWAQLTDITALPRAMARFNASIFLHRVLQRSSQRIGAAEHFPFAETMMADPFAVPLAGSFAIFKELGYVRHW